jgi:hypothetical protein
MVPLKKENAGRSDFLGSKFHKGFYVFEVLTVMTVKNASGM